MLNSKKYDLIFKLIKALKKEEASIVELETLSSKMVLQGTSFKLKLSYSMEEATEKPQGVVEEAQSYKWPRITPTPESDLGTLGDLYLTARRSAGCSSSEDQSLNTEVGLHSTAAILEIILKEKKRNKQDLLRALEALGVDINN